MKACCEKCHQQLICSSSRIWQKSADLSHSSTSPRTVKLTQLLLHNFVFSLWLSPVLLLRFAVREVAVQWKSGGASCTEWSSSIWAEEPSWCVIEQCRGGRRHGSSNSPGIGRPGKSPKQGQVMRIDDGFRWIWMAWTKPSLVKAFSVHTNIM